MEICPRWKFTHLTHREALIVAVVMLCVILVDIAGFAFSQDGDIDADGFLASEFLLPSWASSPVFPLLLMSEASASIFVLVVVYKGGRTRQKYHNDRTIELADSSNFAFFQTALFSWGRLFFSSLSLFKFGRKKLTNIFAGPLGFSSQGGIEPCCVGL